MYLMRYFFSNAPVVYNPRASSHPVQSPISPPSCKSPYKAAGKSHDPRDGNRRRVHEANEGSKNIHNQKTTPLVPAAGATTL
jgi:hypothetical protein